MSTSPRDLIGLSIDGKVLEVGPGSRPFVVAPTAKVKYADRPVEGGRDKNFPELIGQPPGIQAHYNVDLDTEGLPQLESGSFDGLVASHVIEHVANPLEVIAEFYRVLRVGGKLLLVVPDRSRTFDAMRKPTPFSVPLAKYRAGVTEVDEASIREFCEAIYNQPPMHPREVREWYNPSLLNAARFVLHRRRTIHVHAWSPEEFASLLVAGMSEGAWLWRLNSMYFAEHLPRSQAIEFALLLEKIPDQGTRQEPRRFVEDWCEKAMDDTTTRPLRLLRFQDAMTRDGIDRQIATLPSMRMTARCKTEGRTNCEEQLASLRTELDTERAREKQARERGTTLFKSVSWQVTSFLGKVMSLVRG
ncbi:methyltransferase domain-containing protein [Variovorax boronicumulans]|uniref:methyltransferase domain-containing protein n=1 Tax=Variovorax boronicumulans TaxID=436515 RepID=UPI0012E53DFB|nr:class I SAM-dependent methyltransferase [Variovorax boronicumulans]GER14157.1 methyltransferase domain-containing protein [Variovorax boronicumulans]